MPDENISPAHVGAVACPCPACSPKTSPQTGQGQATAPTRENCREPLAIIGIGCHFPGGATSPQAFWELLRSGVDATREVPTDRWDTRKFYDPNPQKSGKMHTCRGGY